MIRLILTFLCFSFVLSAFSQKQKSISSRSPTKIQPKYCLFYDNHTMMACPDVGENFDVEAFTDRIKDCGVDFLTFHARCNQGMAYYDTNIGIKHPSLKYDLFGQLAEACQRKGISISAYLNAGISSAEGLQNRDWTTLYFDGREYRETRFTPYVRTMCYNSPYHNHLVEMVEEVVSKYPVTGIFIDCLGSYPCICPICIKEMKKLEVDWTDKDEVMKFSHSSALRLAKDIRDAVIEINPELLMYFNGVGAEDQIGIGNYLECECLPTAGWGYEYLPVFSHHMRTLGDMPVLNMNGRFYDWADFGGLRPEEAIKSELLYGLANGMRPNIGGHFHPRGDLENAVFDRIENIYKDVQVFDSWFDNAKNYTEIAVVYPNPIKHVEEKLKGVTRMLSELKQQFDIVSPAADWSKYEVLVIPDDVTFDNEITRRVKAHLDAGKAVISSGSSGLDPEQTHFVLEKEWGIKYLKENNFDPAYFTVGSNFNKNLPDMPMSLYSSGINIEPLPGTDVEANLIKPYYNRHWDGEYAFYYTPPDEITDQPALTIHGRVAHFSHRIFKGYYDRASVELRTVFSNVLNDFLPNPVVKSGNMPSFSRVFVTEQPGRRMVHILSYIPELRGASTQMIEEPIELHDVNIALRNDGIIPSSVYLAPEKKMLPFEITDSYITINIPVSKGYSLVVFE
jgi:hypothetical protein